MIEACPGKSALERAIIEGENPVHDRRPLASTILAPIQSRVARECSLKWVVNLI